MVAFILTIFLQWRWKQIESVCVGWGGINLSGNLDKQILKKTGYHYGLCLTLQKQWGWEGGPTPTCTSYFLFSLLTFIANLTGSFQKYSNFLDTDSFPTHKKILP